MSLNKSVVGVILIILACVALVACCLVFIDLPNDEKRQQTIIKEVKDSLPSNVTVIDSMLRGFSDKIRIYNQDFIRLIEDNSIIIVYREDIQWTGTLYWIIVGGIINYIWW